MTSAIDMSIKMTMAILKMITIKMITIDFCLPQFFFLKSNQTN